MTIAVSAEGMEERVFRMKYTRGRVDRDEGSSTTMRYVTDYIMTAKFLSAADAFAIMSHYLQTVEPDKRRSLATTVMVGIIYFLPRVCRPFYFFFKTDASVVFPRGTNNYY